MFNDVAFMERFKSYGKTKTNYMYSAGLAGEVLSLACIEKGYDPVGAGDSLHRLMEKR